MWDAEVKSFIKEIICKHNADRYLPLHPLCSVFAGATHRHIIYYIAISACSQDFFAMGNHLSLGLQEGKFHTQMKPPKQTALPWPSLCGPLQGD